MAQQTWAEARAGFVTSYMDEATAQRHAASIGGRCIYVWASGIDTWHVFTADGRQ